MPAVKLPYPDRLAGLPVEVTVCELDPKETCDVCGAPLEKIGRKVVRSEVEYIKAQESYASMSSVFINLLSAARMEVGTKGITFSVLPFPNRC